MWLFQTSAIYYFSAIHQLCAMCGQIQFLRENIHVFQLPGYCVQDPVFLESC